MYDEILRNAVNTGEWGKRVNKMMRAQETKMSRVHRPNNLFDDPSMIAK